jgi:hypothetical protein
MTSSLAAFSRSIARLMAATAPALTAIRIGPHQHITGLLCQDNTIITTDQALPAQDHYTVVLPSGDLVTARPGPRDRVSNVAALHLEAPVPVDPLTYGTATLGGLVVLLAADADAFPTVRLSVVHRIVRTAEGPAAVLDLTTDQIAQGGPVLDPDGRLIGLTDIGPNGEAFVVSSAAISRALLPAQPSHTRVAPAADAAVPSRRGWLGVALQPIRVPDSLLTRAGQKSGRMVVRLTAGGPAERGGLRVGDVLLALNGTSASAPHSLRSFLGPDRIGSMVEVKLLREGTFLTTQLMVAKQPGGQSD